jgi:6-phosphogluconolactonase
MAIVTIVDDEEAVAVTSAERITALIERSIDERGSAVVSLTGGRTPERLYTLLADTRRPWRERIEWSHVHLFWGDERHVAPDHADSNFGMANRTLVSHVPIPPAQVYRMRGEIADAGEAARDYDATLARGFIAAGRDDRTFDVMLLGLGEDAHIASVFPGSPLLGSGGATVRLKADTTDDTTATITTDVVSGFSRADVVSGLSRADVVSAFRRTVDSARVAAVWAPHLQAWRITLTPAAILDSRSFVVVVAGPGKADAVVRRSRAEQSIVTAAQLLRRAQDRVDWIIDRAAAARLRDAPRA